MPRQCTFVYANSYSKGQMSENEVQQLAVSNCNRKLAELGPLGENYSVDCRCQVVISDEHYVVPRNMLQAKEFLRSGVDLLSRPGRQRGPPQRAWPATAALIGRDRSVTFSVDNPRGERVCEGTFTNDGPANGRFSMSCFGGKFGSNGTYQSKTGSPNDHIIARGHTDTGQPVSMVIGLPAQLAGGLYGGI